jgi:hypothetical protein
MPARQAFVVEMVEDREDRGGDRLPIGHDPGTVEAPNAS